MKKFGIREIKSKYSLMREPVLREEIIDVELFYVSNQKRKILNRIINFSIINKFLLYPAKIYETFPKNMLIKPSINIDETIIKFSGLYGYNIKTNQILETNHKIIDSFIDYINNPSFNILNFNIVVNEFGCKFIDINNNTTYLLSNLSENTIKENFNTAKIVDNFYESSDVLELVAPKLINDILYKL